MVLPDKLTDDDRWSLIEIDRKDAESQISASRFRRGLSLGLLPVGLRRCGLWARQLQFGRLSILCVRLDRSDLKRQSEYERLSLGRLREWP